jgi:hypothetical protein
MVPRSRLLTPICLLTLSSGTVAQPADHRRDYTIEGLTLGSQIQSIRSPYQEYRCGPSEQSPGYTFCQRIRFERDQHGSYNVMNSFLHSRDGIVVYVDRYQRPAFSSASDAVKTIKELSSQFGEPSWTTRMPERAGRPHGVVAVWGETMLEPIDEARLKALADGRSAGLGYLVDFLGDLARSVKEQLPIYRFRGLAGFVWVASFDDEGRGIARSTAVDASAFDSSPNKR